MEEEIAHAKQALIELAEQIRMLAREIDSLSHSLYTLGVDLGDSVHESLEDFMDN